jgi:hypothetical protein
MKKTLLYLIILVISIPVFAQPNNYGCNQQAKTKVMLIGDSWAYFSWLYKAYRESFRKFGHADKLDDGLRSTAIGARGETFLDPAVKSKVMYRLQAQSDVEAIVLFLGGNDFMWAWDAGDPWEDLSARWDYVTLKYDTIISYLREVRPDIMIIAASYDYPNFVDPIVDFPWNPYYDTWSGLGFPTPFQANEALNFIEVKRERWCDSIGIKYVNNLGLMQYIFGQKDPLPVWPYDPYPPKSVPRPGGDWNYPTPQEAMGLLGIDAYHLGPEGFLEIANNIMKEVLLPMFRGSVSGTLRSDGRYDGWVTDRGNTGSGELRIGKTKEGRPVKGLLTFYTADIPAEAEITHASLYVTRSRAVGGNPIQDAIFPANARIDIRSGVFGSTVEPEASDFSAEADMEDAGCFVGAAYKNGFAFRVDFREDALQHINKNGVTQFRITFDPQDNSNRMGVYYGGGEPEPYYAPYMDIYYKINGEQVITTIPQNHVGHTALLYPNPATDYLNVEGVPVQAAEDIRVYNSLGSQINVPASTVAVGKYRLDVKALPAGAYFLEVPGQRGKAGFIKQ